MARENVTHATAVDARYFAALERGVFEIPRCVACGRHHFYPRVCCPYCGSERLEWVAPSGRGRVYSTTIVRRAAGDYTVNLIDLEEGPRLMSSVVDVPPESVRIGMPVVARVRESEGGALLVFVPLEDAR